MTLTGLVVGLSLFYAPPAIWSADVDSEGEAGKEQEPAAKVVGVYELPPVESVLVLSVGGATRDDDSSSVQAMLWGHRMLRPGQFVGGSVTAQSRSDTLEVFLGHGSRKTWREESYASVAWEAEEPSGETMCVKRLRTTVQAPHTAESVGFTYVGFKAVEGGHLYPEIGWRNFKRDQHGDYGPPVSAPAYPYYPQGEMGGSPRWSAQWSTLALVEGRVEQEWGNAYWMRWGSFRRAVIYWTLSSRGLFKEIGESAGVGWVF